MATKKRVVPNKSAELLDIGARLAAKYGAENVTRRMVAEEGKVSEPLVSHFFGGTEEAKKKYARRAKSLGMKLPTKAEAMELGRELRRKARAGTVGKKRGPYKKEAPAKKSPVSPVGSKPSGRASAKKKAETISKPPRKKFAPLPPPPLAAPTPE